MSEDKGFLSRWSDRKLRPESDDADAALPTSDEAKPVQDEFEGKSDEEILSILELPEPDTLKLGDTVEKFMDNRVPERIRARALRAFWKTNPLLANIDGLDEYCDDYTDAAMVVENLQTIYQVGKGYATQALDALENLVEDDVQDEAIGAIESIDDEVSGQILAAPEADNPLHNDSLQIESAPEGGVQQIKVAESDHPIDRDVDSNSVAVVPRPRRMQFQ
ncbi:MAG: DUF3306 domain-containing protein [Pseudomonadota bacterium]|nr:DUF3306 domain-containing protein [Pseudomonadota bacterium]